jgi:ceramide glucosyltransferase
MLGRLASELDTEVAFSRYVVEHRIGSETMSANFAHRLRWSRSSRRSRPLGYIGQFFTFPLPVGAIALWLAPESWPIFIFTCLVRGAAAFLVSSVVLKARVNWFLLPIQDLLGFAFWIAGFFGNSIEWRGQRYILNRDGTMRAAR